MFQKIAEDAYWATLTKIAKYDEERSVAVPATVAGIGAAGVIGSNIGISRLVPNRSEIIRSGIDMLKKGPANIDADDMARMKNMMPDNVMKKVNRLNGLGQAGMAAAIIGGAMTARRIGSNSQVRNANQVNAAMAEKTAGDTTDMAKAKPRDFKKEKGYVGSSLIMGAGATSVGIGALEAIKRKALKGSRSQIATGAGVLGLGAIAAAARSKGNAKAREYNEGVRQSFLSRGE